MEENLCPEETFITDVKLKRRFSNIVNPVVNFEPFGGIRIVFRKLALNVGANVAILLLNFFKT